MKKRMNLKVLVLLLGSFFVLGVHAQRYMENLNRGIVAVRPSASEVLISWRITGDEYTNGATYNLYRGSTLIASNLEVSNYVDATSTNDSYTVAAVIGGAEQEMSSAVSPLANQYFTIPVRTINGGYNTYNVNDASVGDLDGDGDYEIVVKRLANDGAIESTDYHYLEAYEMDGTFLWAINLGPNIANSVEVNFLVYDLDNDGKAEIATRTSDGMIDGLGNNIGDRDGDGQTNYRATMAYNSSYYRIDGPDYISIFNGETGGEIAWDNYIERDPLSQWGTSGMSNSQLGHRATKCMWAVAYLDGVNPSFVIGRGIYHRIKLEAWNFSNGSLMKQWAFDSDPNGSATNYTGEGNHNLAAGDVDGDGRDEITYGAMAVDEYGSGLYATNYKHGDAGHLADINPNIPGLEFFMCHESANGSTIPGLSLRNASTGSMQWTLAASGDIGRCMAADIDENHYGMEFWGSEGSGVHSCTGAVISSNYPTTAGGGASYNFGIWWDGDVQRELVDRTVITKWNSGNQSTDRVATLYNIASISANNSTKSNPCLMADIMGDWREEVIFRSSDNSGMVVFVTPFVTSQRMYTLMHDPNYRSAIAWQNMSYNQPPNLGFYFGGGMATPPDPNIKIVGGSSTPGSISVTASADNGQVDLSWTSTLISTNYQIMRNTTSDAAGRTRIAITNNSTTTYTDTDVTNGTTYYYWIKSTDDNGNTINSDVASATPAACTGTTITPYAQVDGGSWSSTSSVSVDEGGIVKFGPWPTSGGSWFWNGPNNFTASTREVEISSITAAMAGNYTAEYTNSVGCVSSLVFTITVNSVTNQYSISTSTSGSGSVSGAGTYDEGTTVTLTANASNGWSFTSWSGGISSTNNPISFTASSDLSVVANFTEDPPAEAEIAMYSFDQTSGSNIPDQTGNGSNATANGSYSYASGQVNNALVLDGGNAYASMPTGIVSELTNFTIATWVNLDAVEMWSRIFDIGTGTTSNMFLTPYSGGGAVRFAITNSGGGGEQQINGSSALSAGTWIHVAVTLSGSTGTLYVDGSAVGTNNSMTLTPSDLGNTSLNYIGQSQYQDPFLDGMVDEFHIYNYALSATEIESLYNDENIVAEPATLTKNGSGSSIQTVDVNTSINSFYYTWGNATGVSVSGLPTGVNYTIDYTAQTVSISGTPTVSGTYAYTVTTTGGTSNVSMYGTITVNQVIPVIALTIEENAVGFCSVDGSVDNNNSGFSGNGFANTDNASGNGVSWKVNIPSSGSYNLVWRYANGGSTDRTGQIMVDGSTVVSSVSMPSTGSWTSWTSTSGNTISLSSGDRVIRLEATNGAGLSNIDYFEITGAQPTGLSCVGEKSANTIISAKVNSLKLYPNPVNGNMITLAGYFEDNNQVNVLIYDEIGLLKSTSNLGIIEKGNFTTEISLNGLQTGMYFVKLIMGSSVETMSLIKQ